MQLKKITALFVAGALALGAGFAQAAPSALDKAVGKPSDKSRKDEKDKANTFEDWRLQCQKPEGAPVEVCELTQFAIVMNKGAQDQAKPEGEAKGQLLLTVGIIKPVAAEPARMIMRAPLGVFLQPAPIVKVPGHKDVQIPFLRCDEKGCFSIPVQLGKEFVDAGMAVDAALAKDPKAANGTVTIAFQVTQPGQASQRTEVTLPFSFKGFTSGLAALEAKMSPTTASKPAAGKGDKEPKERKESGKKK